MRRAIHHDRVCQRGVPDQIGRSFGFAPRAAAAYALTGPAIRSLRNRGAVPVQLRISLPSVTTFTCLLSEAERAVDGAIGHCTIPATL